MRSGDLHRRWAFVSWVLAVALLAGAVVLPDRAATAQAADEGVSFVVSAGTSASLNGRGSFLARVGFAPGAPIAPLRLPAACNTVGAVTYRVENFLTGEPLGDGLNFDAATRTISGSPTASANRVYKLIATDSGGTAGIRADTAQFVFRLSISASHATTTNTSTDCTTTPTTTTTTVPPPTTPTTTTTTTVPPPTTTTTTTTVPVAAPTATGRLAAVDLTAGAAATTINVAAAFTGTVHTYGATSSHPTTVTASTRGSILSLTPQAAGTATVTITATNTTGTATQTLTATVKPPAPTTSGTLPPQTLTTGGTANVDVAAAFTGTIDTYGATSSHPAIATATTSGSTLTLVGVSEGRATITVTAANTTRTAQQSFTVTVASAPQTAGTLAAQTVTAGASVHMDMASAFTGTVDSYVATSSNGAVLDISLAGSTLTLTGVAAGSATVTVTAANATGNATQTMTVTVNLPPAPTLAAALAAQTLQVTETLTVDVAAGFAGQIDSYTATSGDTNKLTATAHDSTVTLTGVAAGSTTVTVTAINAAGRAARSFNVTINALVAPQTANTPTARTIAVGEELPIHIADAFTGIVHYYTATSNNTGAATVSVDGSTVTLVGVAAGTTTISLTATNTAGSATQTLTATVQTPEELTIALAAPSHCLGSEGVLAPGGGRRGVGSIDLTYHVTGGAGPYTVTSPDAPDTTQTEPTGTLTIPCSQRGINLATAGPQVNVVEAGPRTLTVTATENTGTTATADIQIEIAESAYTTEYNNGLMHPGNTYILGTPDQWVLATLPDGLTLQFSGLSEHNVVHFTEPATGTEILLDWTTGTELGRTTPTRTSTPTTSTKQTSATSMPSSAAPVRRLAIVTPGGLTHGADTAEWRPYAGLPNSYTLNLGSDPEPVFYPQVAIHPRMLIGKPIRVCAGPDIPETLADFQAFKDNVKAGAKAWNDSIKDPTDPTKGWNPSFPRELFKFLDACTNTTDPELNADLTVLRVKDQDDAGNIVIAEYCGNDVGACAITAATGTNPPIIGGDEIIVKTSNATDRGTMIHELGHFLGLGDYAFSHVDKCGDKDPRRLYFRSVMAGGACNKDSVQTRDLVDLHLVYHPYERTGMHFNAVGASGWELDPGDPPRDTGRELIVAGRFSVREYRYVSNAAAYVVFRRALGSTGVYTLVGKFSRDASKVITGSHLSLDFDREEIEGQVFYVYGVTGGDIEQSTSTYLEVHATLPFDLGSITGALGLRDWTLGHGATVYGPPVMPTNVRTEIGSRKVDVVWPHVVGATDYDVYRHDTKDMIEEPTKTGAHPENYREKRNVSASTRTSCGMRVTFNGLENRSTYYFRIRANRDGVPLGSRLSTEVSGKPLATPSSSGSSAGQSGGGDRSVSASSAASADPCTPPEEVDLDEGDPYCPRDDDYSWVLREVVGGDPVCDRVEVDEDGAVSTTVEWCDVTGDELRPSAGGARVCAREVLGTLRSRPGPPECEKGFSLVPVLVGGVPLQVCSKTDSRPASV